MEGRFRQREQTDRGKVQAKGLTRELTDEGRFRKREQTDGGKGQAKGED